MDNKNDFDDPKEIFSIGFLPDDSFVYLDNDTATFYRVDINNLSAGKVEDDQLCQLYLVRSRNSEEYEWFRGYSVSDWIDDRYCIANCYIVDTEIHEFTEFIPGNSRENWSGVVSPDGSKIAFLSIPKEGNEAPNLYIVAIEGGNPIKVESENFFMRTGAYSSFSVKIDNMLLDWY